MTPDNYEILIDHFDKTLGDPEGAAIPGYVLDDPQALQEWKYLRVAVEAVRFSALTEQVAAVKKILKEERTELHPIRRAVVRRLVMNTMKVAALLFLVLSLSGIAKYVLTSPAGIYEKYYAPYDLNVSRGDNTADKLEKAYKNRDWATVQNIFVSQAAKTNKVYFLAGMADMQQRKYADAIQKLKMVIAGNGSSKDPYFQDESEYYLAMSYLATNQAPQAMAIFAKIKADKNHLYNKRVMNMSRVDMLMLNAK